MGMSLRSLLFPELHPSEVGLTVPDTDALAQSHLAPPSSVALRDPNGQAKICDTIQRTSALAHHKASEWSHLIHF
jgi:hypothetical protein